MGRRRAGTRDLRVSAEHKSTRFSDRGMPAESGSLDNSRDYSSALAYELISQLRSISSCCGVVHSMVWLLEIGTSNAEKDSTVGREKGSRQIP